MCGWGEEKKYLLPCYLLLPQHNEQLDGVWDGSKHGLWTLLPCYLLLLWHGEQLVWLMFSPLNEPPSPPHLTRCTYDCIITCDTSDKLGVV